MIQKFQNSWEGGGVRTGLENTQIKAVFLFLELPIHVVAILPLVPMLPVVPVIPVVPVVPVLPLILLVPVQRQGQEKQRK